ncbi:hypothetical protein SAMN05443667_101693 [Flavobacterium gillisiae]|uniref:Uncharacterized protein n=1 Tax=Flavobacterium gillisiae TaxID=150146 RepID=A0A1H3XYN7_9FLAO|nr:hypothetical protein [Flavobacterium gillisiae]SEA03662.1 hypothetical protein SAMN05443667_101693 [Flavobacterium gillisiae]
MKKIILFLLLTAISSASYAQKADTEKKKIKINIPKSELFKNILTYNIIIQGDDTWNADFANKKYNRRLF